MKLSEILSPTDFSARELGAALRVETAILSGWAGRSIVEYARQKRIDLIVLGTHGRTGVTHAILGSVAETGVRLAPCLVCGAEREELICEVCRARSRGEALEQKLGAERPGRRGSPA